MTPDTANITSAISIPAITTQEQEIRKERAQAIDTFLEKRKSSLAGYGMKFVEEAEKNGIDYRLLVSISGRESSFAKDGQVCKGAKNSVFGYGSCKINFKSIDESIEVVSRKIGGESKHYHSEMTTYQILRKYNTVIPNYPNEVIRIMKMIDDSEEIV